MKTSLMEPVQRLKKFEGVENEQFLAEDDHFWVVPDRYPVSPGHTLIISKSSKSRFRDLSRLEKVTLMDWIEWTVNYLESHLDPKPNGFNFGVNDGQAAGQTKNQFHFHIIPRYDGDCEDPRGGVRHVFPQKAKYWS